jgi:hypothetical protein
MPIKSQCRASPPYLEEPSQTRGSCRAPAGTTSLSFGDGVIVSEGAVHHRAPNLEHQVHAAGRPPHLLLGIQTAVQQLHRALGDRCRDWLLSPSGRCIVDDDIGRTPHTYVSRSPKRRSTFSATAAAARSSQTSALSSLDTRLWLGWLFSATGSLPSHKPIHKPLPAFSSEAPRLKR